MSLPLPATPAASGSAPVLTSTQATARRAASLQRLIRDGATAGLRRRRLYRLAIESQLESAYAQRLTAADRRLAARRLLTDPRVRQLLDRLFNAA